MRQMFEDERSVLEAEKLQEVEVPELTQACTAKTSERFVREMSRGITVVKYERTRGGSYSASIRHLKIDANDETIRWSRQLIDLGKIDRLIRIQDLFSFSIGPKSKLFRSCGCPATAEPWHLLTLRVRFLSDWISFDCHSIGISLKHLSHFR